MKQELVTLPRSVVEQALEALTNCTNEYGHRCNRCDSEVDPDGNVASALRAALEQPQNHCKQNLDRVPAGWKLVPVEPTDDMLYDIQEFSHILPPRGKRIWAHMLAAAPQPPTTEQSSAVQPQGEQEPFAWISPRALEWGARQSEKVVKLTCKAQPEYDFTEPLYTHPQNLRCKSNQARLATLWGYVKPQPKREPLTDEAVLGVAKSIEIQFDSERLNEQIDDILAFARAIEHTHNIK